MSSKRPRLVFLGRLIFFAVLHHEHQTNFSWCVFSKTATLDDIVGTEAFYRQLCCHRSTAMKKSRYCSRYCKCGRYIYAIPTVLHYLPPYLPLHILFYNIYLNIYLFWFWHHTTYLFSDGVWTFLLLRIRYYYIYHIIYPLFFKLQYLSTFLHFRNAYYHIHRNI